MTLPIPASLQAFLRTARWPVLPEAQPTFFSIAGIERRELALSNTYAFFFRSDEPHGLGTLFGEALLSLLRQKDPKAAIPVLSGQVRVAREHPMEGGQWLDLLLHDSSVERPIGKDATFAILIENKIDHWLANDLLNYWNSIATACKPEVKRIGVVLGLRPERVDANWRYITHLELARAVEQRLGPVISQLHPRYLPVLLHFLEHLKYMTDTNHDNFALSFDFAQRHRAALAEAQKVIKHINGEGLAAAVTEAFGNGYRQRVWFDDRVDIQHVQWDDFRYVVFFRNVLDLSREPGYAITLYAGGATKQQTAAWRAYLTASPEAQAKGIAALQWFQYNELVVGKSYYPSASSTLAELKAHIAQSLQEDWQPLESYWLGQLSPPAIPL